MKNILAALLIIVVIAVDVSAQTKTEVKADADTIPEKQLIYDGTWWQAANKERREGFFWGAGDCLTSEVHISKGFFGTSKNTTANTFDQQIAKYYAAHPADRKLPVIEVWRKTGRQMADATPPQPSGGEVYTNRHGFLDGQWYRESWNSRYGFLNGYLGCLRTYVDHPADSYSRSVTYYDDHIWDYIAAHPNADDASIADLLHRFRDVSKPN